MRVVKRGQLAYGARIISEVEGRVHAFTCRLNVYFYPKHKSCVERAVMNVHQVY